jgi:hypothetical protein
MTNLPRTSEHIIRQALEKLTGVGRVGQDLKDYFQILDQLDTTRLNLPFRFSKLIVVYERLPVMHEIFNPKPRSHLLDVMADAPGAPFLVTDLALSGADALFVVSQTEIDDSLPWNWIGKAQRAKLIVNKHPKFGLLFAIALTSFQDA